MTKIKTKSQKQTAPVAEAMVNNAPRVFVDFAVPMTAHQGDVILVSLPNLPKGAKVRKNRQVADGDTQGSRHILEGGQIYDCDANVVAKMINANYKGASVEARYVGPVFTTPAVLTHPEHGHHRYGCEGTVAVVFQRNLDALEREQRTLD